MLLLSEAVAKFGVDERVEPLISVASGFAQTKNLLSIGLDFFFVDLGDRKEGANAFFGSRPPFLGSFLSF